MSHSISCARFNQSNSIMTLALYCWRKWRIMLNESPVLSRWPDGMLLSVCA